MSTANESKRIFNNVNVLGNIHLDDPENIPERSFLTGPGTDRPVGFFPAQFAKLFWIHRTFTCAVYGLMPLDLLGAFLAAGGATGTIVGSLIGLALSSMIGGVTGLSTKTRVAAISRSKIRVTLPGINEGITQGKANIIGKPKDPESKNPLNLDNEIKPNILSSFHNDVNEGSTALGSYHFGQSSNGFLSIDFRDVVFVRDQYWPRIVLMFGSTDGNIGPAFSSVQRITSLDGRPERDLIVGGPWNVQVAGGVIFNGAVIPIYGNSYFPFGSFGFAVVNGSIEPPPLSNTKNPCSNMSWDTFNDSAREGYNEEECKKVFREDRGSSSSSP